MMKYIIIMLFTLTLIGCSDCEPEDVAKLRVGMTKTKMLEILGEPRLINYESDGDEYVWNYGHRSWLYVELNETNTKIKSWH